MKTIQWLMITIQLLITIQINENNTNKWKQYN